MERLLEFITNHSSFKIDEKNKWSILRSDTTNKITHIYFKTDLLTMCIIGPHIGNYDKYILRSHSIANFDRWSVAASEYSFETAEEVENMLLNNMGILYKEALEDLASDYTLEFNDREYYQDKYYKLKAKYREVGLLNKADD